MAEQNKSHLIESCLITHFEPGYLVANLYERVGGRLRLVGRGVNVGLATEFDHAEALVQALTSLEQSTGRRLLRNGAPIMPRTPEQRGVDGILASVRSSWRGIRWSLVYTGNRPSMQLLAQVSAAAGCPPMAMFALGSDEAKKPALAAQRVAEMFSQPIDALVFLQDPAVKFDEPQQQALLTIGAAASVMPNLPSGSPPFCILGAGGDLSMRCRLALGDRVQYIDAGQVLERDGSLAGHRLAEAFLPVGAECATSALGGLGRLSVWFDRPPFSSRAVNLRAAAGIAQALGVTTLRLLDMGLPPDVVEVTGRHTRGLSMRSGGSLIVDDRESPDVALASLTRVAYPWSIAATAEDVRLETRWLRNIVGDLPESMTPIEAIVVTGTPVYHENGAAWAACMGLAVASSPGIFSMWNDASGALIDAAVLAHVNPFAGDEVYAGALTRLGSAIVGPKGGAGPLRVDAQFADGYRLAIETSEGDLDVLPIDNNTTVRVQVRPSGRQDFGAGPGRVVDTTVRGGEIGLVIDNRCGALPDADNGVMQRWIQSLRGLAPRLGRPPAQTVGVRLVS